jgi:hypothetical protein
MVVIALPTVLTLCAETIFREADKSSFLDSIAERLIGFAKFISIACDKSRAYQVPGSHDSALSKSLIHLLHARCR